MHIFYIFFIRISLLGPFSKKYDWQKTLRKKDFNWRWSNNIKELTKENKNNNRIREFQYQEIDLTKKIGIKEIVNNIAVKIK